MANEDPNVIATDDPELAKSLGFTDYDQSTGQWTKTPETVEEVEQYAADEREQGGEVTAHATGTVTPGEGEPGGIDFRTDDDDEVDDDEDHPAV